MLSKIGNIKVLSCGYCTQSERLISKEGRWKFVHFPAKCFLIPLQEGYLLFDSGYSADAKSIMSTWPACLYKALIPVTVTPKDTAVKQLAAMGISAQEIKYIFISHFHADHIGGLRDFPNARFICSQEGYKALKKLSKFRQVCKGFVADFLPEDFEKRVVFVSKNNTQKLNNLPAYPLDNLPNMYAVELPGHARGQLGLFLKNENILFAADAVWHRANLRQGGRPSFLALLFAESKKEYLQTLSVLQELKDTKIFFTHGENDVL